MEVEEKRWQCRCACHNSLSSIKHVVPCCDACPYCHQLFVIRGLQDVHLEKCSIYHRKNIEGKKDHEV